MAPYLLFFGGVFTGLIVGVLIIGLLLTPRVAEMDETIQSLRAYIRYLLKEEEPNVQRTRN